MTGSIITVLVIGQRKYEGKLMEVLGGKDVLRASVDVSLEEVMERTSVQLSSSESSCLVSRVSIVGNTLDVVI
jgi:hypothetical protein